MRFLLSIDVNLQRNHFTSSQLAVVALDIEKIFAVEAKERQGQRNDLNIQTKLSECSKGESAAKAAIMLKTSATYVKDAKKLEKDAPDLLEKVRSGDKLSVLLKSYRSDNCGNDELPIHQLMYLIITPASSVDTMVWLTFCKFAEGITPARAWIRFIYRFKTINSKDNARARVDT